MSGANKSTLRAVVSHDLCTGTGMCIRTAPHAFRYNRERVAIFKGPGAWTEEDLLAAMDACPMSAISILEADDA
jgi:ferredoxin